MDELRSLSERLKKIYAPLERLNVITGNNLSGLTGLSKSLNGISSITQELNNGVLKQATDSLTKLNEKLEEIANKTPESLIALANYGWYLNYDCEISFPINLETLIKNNEINRLNEVLITHFEGEFDNIFEELSSKHPKREGFFQQIYFAHKNEYYFLSIPVLLTQVDGISDDLLRKKFFLRNRKYLPQVSDQLQNNKDIFHAPIFNEGAINAHESRLHQFPVRLNRHEILHGTDTKFGNKINSLKCLSLVKYLSDILYDE